MSKKGKTRKNYQQEEGPDQSSDPGDKPLPADMSDEADPPTRAILAAIANRRNEVTPSYNDICASIEARLQTVCTELREELVTTKKEIQSSIKTLEAATAAHEKTIKELERSASLTPTTFLIFNASETWCHGRHLHKWNTDPETCHGHQHPTVATWSDEGALAAATAQGE
ncbi:hypothetical protein PAMA_006536 [Pampus argenteus]